MTGSMDDWLNGRLVLDDDGARPSHVRQLIPSCDRFDLCLPVDRTNQPALRSGVGWRHQKTSPIYRPGDHSGRRCCNIEGMQDMKLDLVGRSVLVTGGNRGIGLAIALAFAEEGANVAICGRDKAALAEAEARIAAKGVKAKSIAVDLFTATGCSDAVATAVNAFGGAQCTARRRPRAPEHSGRRHCFRGGSRFLFFLSR